MKPLNSFLWVLLLAAAVAAQNSSNTEATATVVVLVGAGDIASCDDLKGAEATANLLDRIPGTVFAVGDLAYPDGSDEQFVKCYGPTWGRFKVGSRTGAMLRRFGLAWVSPFPLRGQ